MASITVPGVPSSRKQPGILLNVVLGGPGTSAGDAPTRLLIVGSMLSADVTGASPAFTVPAGTYRTGAIPTSQPVSLLSEVDAIQRFGAGSELHLMAKAVFDQYPDCPLDALPILVAPPTPTAAAARIYVAGTATEAGTIRLWIAGQIVDVNVAVGDTDVVIVTAITNAVLAVTSLPVTAQYAAGPVSPVTLTAKHVGIRGNAITLRINVISSLSTVDVPATTAGTSPPANTVTLLGLTLGIYNTATVTTPTMKYLTGGAGDDAANLTAALASASKTLYHRVVISSNDGAGSNSSGDRLKQWLAAQAVPTKGLTMQGAMAYVGAMSTAYGPSTISERINFPRLQVLLHPKAEQTPGEIAAQTMAARLIGDVQAGGQGVGESTDPGSNLDGTRLVSITLQPYDGDRLSADDPDTALQYGLTPLVGSAGRAGYVEISRSTTSRWKDDTGAPNYGVLDTSDVTVTDYVAGLIRQRFAVSFKGARLAPDDPESPPQADRTTTPLLVRAWVHALLKGEESAGHIIEVDDRLDLLKVQARTGVPWWLNAEIPIVPIVGLHVFAANVRQLTARL